MKFIALPVVAGPWLAALPPPPARTALLHAADLHVTIAFLGPASDEAAQAAWQALRWGLPSMAVSLADVVPMGAPHRPSAFAALLGDGRGEVERAIAATRDLCCDAAHAKREDRPPKAHLTVARPTREAGPQDRADGVAWAAALDLRAVEVTLDRLALFGPSGATGARYRILAERPLPTGGRALMTNAR